MIRTRLVPGPDPGITHTLSDILRARIFATAGPAPAKAGSYPDADDLDDLRKDPAFKLACGRLPESGDDLASQPTLSRWENAPDLCTLIRLTQAMVDLWCESHRRPPKAITRDIDDTPALGLSCPFSRAQNAVSLPGVVSPVRRAMWACTVEGGR